MLEKKAAGRVSATLRRTMSVRMRWRMAKGHIQAKAAWTARYALTAVMRTRGPRTYLLRIMELWRGPQHAGATLSSPRVRTW